jgi:uncharacterized membrane protein YgdD (TMEM256/DUF423 family)
MLAGGVAGELETGGAQGVRGLGLHRAGGIVIEVKGLGRHSGGLLWISRKLSDKALIGKNSRFWMPSKKMSSRPSSHGLAGSSFAATCSSACASMDDRVVSARYGVSRDDQSSDHCTKIRSGAYNRLIHCARPARGRRNMPGRRWFILGAMLGALAVMTGAFGAHGLKGNIDKLYSEQEVQTKRLEQWDTAVQYHFYHVAGLLALGLLPGDGKRRLRLAAGALFLLGLAGFSGGLYALVLFNLPLLGASIVPLGGTCWIGGWVCLALSTATKSH